MKFLEVDETAKDESWLGVIHATYVDDVNVVLLGGCVTLLKVYDSSRVDETVCIYCVRLGSERENRVKIVRS